MTILLTKNVRVAGSVLAAGTTQTLEASLEGSLVERMMATYVSDPSTALHTTPVMASKTLTGGNEFSIGNKKYAGVLLPSGGDDSANIEAYVATMASLGLPAVLGPGDFIVSQPMTFHSRQLISKWGNKGVGLRVVGQGAGNTRIYYSGASESPMITVNAPTAEGIGARNYLTEISGMSWLRATSGTTEIAAGTTSGSAFYGTPAQAGNVLHTSKLKDLFIDGFDYPITLSDSTLMELDTVWCSEFLVGVRLGYNIDLLRIRHSMFGSEQFGATFRNSAIAIQDGFSDGLHTAGGTDQIQIENTWCMKIGLVASLSASNSLLIGDGCYFEGVRQYVNSASLVTPLALTIRNTHLSIGENEDAGYPKFSFGAAAATTLNVIGCTGTGTSPSGGYFALRGTNSVVNWMGNSLYASGSGNSVHLRWAKTGEEHVRTVLPNKGAGTYCFVGATGMSKSSGPEIPLTAATTGTLSPAHIDGDQINIGPMSGNVTINPSASSPYNPAEGTKMTYVIQANATTPASFAVTWSSFFILPVAFTQPGAGDASKRTVMQFERRQGKWYQVGYGNVWY